MPLIFFLWRQFSETLGTDLSVPGGIPPPEVRLAGLPLSCPSRSCSALVFLSASSFLEPDHSPVGGSSLVVTDATPAPLLGFTSTLTAAPGKTRETGAGQE